MDWSLFAAPLVAAGLGRWVLLLAWSQWAAGKEAKHAGADTESR